jgi:hypothetical protein
MGSVHPHRNQAPQAVREIFLLSSMTYRPQGGNSLGRHPLVSTGKVEPVSNSVWLAQNSDKGSGI